MDKTVELIANIIEDVADIPAEDINADSLIMDDLDLSSLEIMSLIAELEHKLSISISEKELLSLKTVGDLAELANGKVCK